MRRKLWWSFALAALAGCSAADVGVDAVAPAAAVPAGHALERRGTGQIAAAARTESAVGSATTSTSTSTSTSASALEAGARLTSRGYVTWIRPEPKTKSQFLGYVRHGNSVALFSTEKVKGAGCPNGFYRVQPRGYVCDDATVTLEPAPVFVDASMATSATSGPFPYRYAMSNGAPMYNRVPALEEGLRRERPFGKAGKFLKLPKTLSAHEDLAVVEPIAAGDPLPSFLAEGQPPAHQRLGLVRQTIPLGSMLSFTKAFEANGRTWLLSPDLTVVPADRMRPFKPSTFRGVHLGEGGAELPLAWMRKTDKPKLRKSGEAFVPTGQSWGVRTSVGLTGQRVEQGNRRWLETTEADVQGGQAWILESDATVVEAEPKMPFGVKPDQKWFLVRITAGTLVAYKGPTPQYATLISPGSGGVPVPGKDPVKMSTTPLGTYPVTFKDRAATMSPEQGEDRSFWIADVPHTQYFDPPFALHASYWHERFGEPTSAGCVNLSPIDAEILFGWSDPPVPDGWQGATGAGAKENGPTTIVVVRR